MNRILFAVALAICLVAVSTGTAVGLCPEKMISYWELNEDNPVVTGYFDTLQGTIGAICSICPDVTPQGMIDQAQLFDGTATDVMAPASAVYNWKAAGDFSIESWVRVANTLSTEGVIIGRTDPLSSLDWRVSINGNGQVRAFLIAVDGSGSAGALSGSDDLRDGAWHHIVFVRDGATDGNHLYVDGVLVDSTGMSYTADFNSSTSGISIGSLDTGSGYYFSGTVDEVALYSKALSEMEILQHYRDGFIGLRWGYCGSNDPIRIMPLGNSITRGSFGDSTPDGDLVGFRRSLYKDLNDADLDGHTDYVIDFVGSQQEGGNVPLPGNPDFDIDHEGLGGTTALAIKTNVGGYLSANPADVVLLHIGTNDITNGQDVTGIVNEVDGILDNIDVFDPAIPVVLAKIINRRDPTDPEGLKTSVFNNALQTLVDTRLDIGDRILVVDHESALAYPEDIIDDPVNDDVHPNLTGYGKMADVWYEELVTFLPPTHIAPPLITSTPVIRANLNTPYIYDVDADGNEPPQYALSVSPGGMGIDATTGIISWTPATRTPVSVEVEASNPRGTDTQAFGITVGDNPEAVNDGYGPMAQSGTLVIAPSAGVLINDTDADLDQLESVLVTDVARGTLTLNTDGSFTYVHDGSFTTSDGFTYQAYDGAGYSDTAAVNISVDLTPVAVNDAYGPITQSGTLEVDQLTGVLANDTDAESAQLEAVLVSNASNGALTLGSDGSFTYVHDGSATSDDSFTYQAYDGVGYSANTTVDITVNLAPSAVQDVYDQVPKGEIFTVGTVEGVLSNDVDPEDDPLVALLLSDVSNGTLNFNPDGSFTYEHDGGDMMTDMFSYRVYDGMGYSGETDVDITIDENAAPEITGQGRLETSKGKPLTISLLNLVVDDPDSEYPQDFSISVYDGANYGLEGSTITPASGFTGRLTVPVSVNDSLEESNIFDLKVDVNEDKGSDSSGPCFIGSLGMDAENGKDGYLFAGHMAVQILFWTSMMLSMGSTRKRKK